MHQHDSDWFKKQIGALPVAYREKAVTGYKKAFDEAYNAEPIEHKKMNRARFVANTRLREFVEKVMAVNAQADALMDMEPS